MIKPIFFFLVLQSIFVNTVSAQKEGNVWAFGKSAGLDFNSGTPVSIATGINAFHGCASICDAKGLLLFYTDGSYVWDRNHNIMPNGSGLAGSMSQPPPTQMTIQSSVIVPMPDNPRKYYIFSLTGNGNGTPGKLYYSIVDMALNGGMGDVEAANKSIFLESGLTRKLTAVAGMRQNAWVMVRSGIANEYKAFEVTRSGVNRSPVISVCGGLGIANYLGGEIKFSPNGRKMAAACNRSWDGGLELYDFDFATGIVSNTISLGSADPGQYIGVAFSPDNSKLYGGIFGGGGVCQFDLNVPANAIEGTKIRVSPGPGQPQCGSVKLGPDGKIYIINNSGSGSTISVINFPNLAGAACQYVNNGVPLVFGIQQWGLPNEIVTPLTGKNDTVYYCSNSTSVRLIDSGFGPKAWQVISGPGVISGSGDTVTVTTTANTTVIFIDSSVRYIDTTTIIVVDAKVDAGPDDTALGCNGFLDTLHATLVNTLPGFTYNIAWQPSGSVIAGGNTLQPVVAPVSATTYKIIVTTPAVQGGCSWEDSVHITTIDRSVHAGFVYATAYGCNGDTVMFTNTSTGSGTLQYRWAFEDGTGTVAANATHIYKTGGQYTVKLYVSNGLCMDSITQVVTIAPRLAASFTVKKDTVCQRDTVFFTNTSIGTGILSNWDFGYEYNDTATDPSYVYDTPGLYKVTLAVSDHRGCRDTISRFIRVDAMGSSSFIVGDSICAGEALVFEGRFGEVTPLNYTWDFGDGHASWNDNPAQYTYTAAGTYYPILITRYRACPEYRAHDTVHVFAYPAVDLGPDTSLCPGQATIALVDYTKQADGYSNLWSTGVTRSAIEVTTPGIYWLRITNAQGCATTDTITVNKGCYVAIPNAFTPNGDGVNDYFFPRQLLSMNITAFSMQIYNRWGQMIFETNTTNGRGWDGTQQPEGVYIYLLDVTFANRTTEKYKGNVTLLR